MRERGKQYHQWHCNKSHTSKHSEILVGGIQIDVQARISPRGMTLIFVGAYGNDGRLLFEECYATLHRCPYLALAWGMEMVKSQRLNSPSARDI